MSKKNGKKLDLGIKIIAILILGIILEICLTVKMGLLGFIIGLIIAFIIIMLIVVGANGSNNTKINAFLEHKNKEK